MTNDKSSRTRKPTTSSGRAQTDEAQVPGSANTDVGDSNLVKDLLTGSSVEQETVSQNPANDST